MKVGVLEYIEDNIDGDLWENICNSCYRMRYEKEHYTEIPAVQGGDAGIEGFTTTGVVTQCYCPEREYDDDALYCHLRDKMSKDIDKLKKPSYRDRLKKLGVPPIHEWHFVIPYYKDSRIIEHAEKKRNEILEGKETNENAFAHIANDFRIIIQTAENYRVEITRLICTRSTDVKLNFAILHNSKPDWEKCDSEKVDNIKRKVKAVMGTITKEKEKDYKDVVALYTQAYMTGIDILNKLYTSYTEVYEKIFDLQQSYKKQVQLKTMMNTDSSMNKKIFYDILNDFGEKLEKEFSYLLNSASIMELQLDLISGWLADCTMRFRG